MTEPNLQPQPHPETATLKSTDADRYRALRRQQLLEQCKTVRNLKADIDRRKLAHIINHAVSSAFA